MNRQQRRKQEREVDKELNVLKSLQGNEVEKVNTIITRVVKDRTQEMINIVDTALTAVFILEDYKVDKIRSLQDEIADMINEHTEKIRLLEKENTDMKVVEKEVREFMFNLINDGVNKKDVIQETCFKFPKLSKSMVVNAYGKILDELKDTELEVAAEYILAGKNISKEVDEMIKKEVKSVDIPKETTLKVVREEIIKELELEGENGKYIAKTGIGVALELKEKKLGFSNIQELEIFYKEFKQVFARLA